MVLQWRRSRLGLQRALDVALWHCGTCRNRSWVGKCKTLSDRAWPQCHTEHCVALWQKAGRSPCNGTGTDWAWTGRTAAAGLLVRGQGALPMGLSPGGSHLGALTCAGQAGGAESGAVLGAEGVVLVQGLGRRHSRGWGSR